MTPELLLNVVEAALQAAGRPLDLDELQGLFANQPEAPDRGQLREALKNLEADLEGRALELKQVAGGFRLQVREEYSKLLGALFAQRPPRYSRALQETLALIAYRQPVTRGEIEEVRGVAVSSNIIRTLLEREWIRVLGHREVPGRPALYGTTREFLDHFNLKKLEELPPLAEVRDLDLLEPDLFASVPTAESAPDQDAGVAASEAAGQPIHGVGSEPPADADSAVTSRDPQSTADPGTAGMAAVPAARSAGGEPPAEEHTDESGPRS